MKTFIAICLSLGMYQFLGIKASKDNVVEDKIVLIPHKIQYENVAYTLNQAVDLEGVSQFYFIDIVAFPCKSVNECKLMQLRMYWDVKGDFLTIELRKDTPLTKLNHKKFSVKDYAKLHAILLDDTSDFKFLTLADLTERQAENSFYETDAASGATVTTRDFECIHGAVKTTYQLWRFANGELKDCILDIENKETLSSLDTTHVSKSFELAAVLSDSNVRELSDYLALVKITTKEEKIAFKNLATLVLSQKGKQGLLMYNFLIRSKLKGYKKNLKYFRKKRLIYSVFPSYSFKE